MSSLSGLTVSDWIFLGVVGATAAVLVVGLSSIRREMRSHAHGDPRSRLDSSPVKLKTSPAQRRQWRQHSRSPELIDLLDDVDTLLRHVTSQAPVTRQDHREAVRLGWKRRHIPVMTFFVLSLALAGVLSAIFMVIAQGPSNPIP